MINSRIRADFLCTDCWAWMRNSDTGCQCVSPGCPQQGIEYQFPKLTLRTDSEQAAQDAEISDRFHQARGK